VFFNELGKTTLMNRIIFFLCKYVIPAVLLLTIGVQLLTGLKVPGICCISGI
jgi:hypothetical protein